MDKNRYTIRLATALVTAALVALLSLLAVPSGQAIPAFSRKYGTSCTTCHNMYPELNDFGWAFKKNGFKFPKDDETFVKQDPVMLGSKAQKEAFPEAVYPGEIPGTIPIAFRYEGNLQWNAQRPQSVTQQAGYLERTDLFVPNTFTIISAGSFGPNLSFWIDDDISAGGTGQGGGLGDAYLKYNDLGHYFHLPLNALNVRFGQFEVDLPFTNARTPYLTPFDIYQEPAIAQQNCVASPQPVPCQTTNNQFVLGAPQRGIEFGGYPNNGNFNWSVAFVDGTNSTYGTSSAGARNSKDIYANVFYQFNLEKDPESRNGVMAAGATGPHNHTSLRVGGFYYYGKNQINQDGLLFPTSGYNPGTINEPFYRAGGYVRYRFRDKLEIYGMGMFGHDNNHLANGTAQTLTGTTPVTYSGGFVAVNWFIYPWLIPTLRYDFVNSQSDYFNGAGPVGPPAGATRNRISPGYQILIRANIKIVGEYQYQYNSQYFLLSGAGPYKYRPNSFMTGIDYAF